MPLASGNGEGRLSEAVVRAFSPPLLPQESEAALASNTIVRQFAVRMDM
jgi:hypothetical protein